MTPPTALLDRLYERLSDARIAVHQLRGGAAPGKPLRAIRASLALADALLRQVEADTEAERASPCRMPGDATGGPGAA